MLYSIGRHLEGADRPALAIYSAVCMTIAMTTDDYDDTLGNYLLTIVLLVGAPILIGRVLRHRARLNRTLVEKTRRLSASASRARSSRPRRSAPGSPASCTTSSPMR